MRNNKESEFNNFDNTKDYNIHETIEFKNIKEVLFEDNLEYMTDYLRNLLKVEKPNNLDCFKQKLFLTNANQNGKRAIIYVRLSVEDIEKSDGNVSKSILNQLLMLLTYCRDKGLYVVGIFYEEGISGSDGSREEWNKTLTFCELGNTDIYICKSQSRFARSIEFVEKYLHKKFIEWNIRFLSIVDNIDTNNKGNKKSSQITAMTDQWRLEDQSVSTRSTFKAKNEAGQWTGSFAPYGYDEDPSDRYHFVIDEEAAKVVRDIYSMYANGLGYFKICKILNDKNIPTPSRYKKLKGSNYVCPVAPNGSTYWNKDTIRKILMDKTYDGILIQHRTENISYDNDKRRIIPEEEQRVVACCHERIIDPNISKIVRKKFDDRKKKDLLSLSKRETSSLISLIENAIENGNIIEEQILELKYKISLLNNALVTNNIEDIIIKFNDLRAYSSTINSQLQKDIQDGIEVFTTSKSRVRPSKDGKIHIFSKKVYCKCCGKTFTKEAYKTGPRKSGKTKAYLKCKNRLQTGGSACDNNNSIQYEKLEEVVLNEINSLINKYYNQSKLEKSYYENKIHSNIKRDIEVLEKEKNDLSKQIALNSERFALLYEDRANKIITTDEFVMLKNKYQNDNNSYNLRIEEINLEISELENKKDNQQNICDIFKKYKHISKLDRIIVDTFISKILIDKIDKGTNTREIKIIWNFNL